VDPPAVGALQRLRGALDVAGRRAREGRDDRPFTLAAISLTASNSPRS
jgi:hypothetical protein